MNRLLCVISLICTVARAATFGTVVPIAGSPTDIVYDSSRNRVYIVDTTQNRIDVYSPAQRTLISPIPVDAQPLSAAVSRDVKYLYVTSFSSSVLDVIDLDAAAVVATVSLPARPEAVAVGADGRVLVTTVGATTSDATTRLLLYDPGSGVVLNISNTLPAPATPTTSTTQVYNSTRSQLLATQDGKYIVGVNISGSSQTAFIYETASGSILHSRSLTNISTMLSVNRDGSKFMSGLSLFDASTMAIVAQQNAANSLYLFPTTANFSTQANQGGSVFAPDGSVLYSAFNIAPVNGSTTTAASTVTSQLMVSDPDNLLIQLAIQLPENLTGKMVITPDGGTVYALSDSGILILPVSTIYDNPIVTLDGVAVTVTQDQCGVTASTRTAVVTASNAGKGRITVSASTNTTTVTSTQGLGGTTGPGGGGPGSVGQPPTPGVIPGGTGTGGTGGATDITTTTANGVAPSLTTHATSTGATLTFTYNPGTSTSLGTGTPVDFVVTAPEAINIPYRIRTTQNYRNSEAAGTIVPASTGVSSSEGLVDMVLDSARSRIYIANSGLNRVEVFDTVNGVFLSPIKVGQLPRSLAMTPDGFTLYVANTGGESISIIDPDKLQVTGTVAFPALTYNASTAVTSPSVIAASLAGLQIVMSNGALWHVIGNKALPRGNSNLIGTTTLTAPRSMAVTPGGEYVLLLAGDGVGYLYDAMSDDFVISQQIASTPIQGYYGSMSAGPKGAYYLVNGQAFNSALTPIAASNNATNSVNHNSAVAAVDSSTYARFIQPTRTNTTAALTTTPTIEIVDAGNGTVRSTANSLEGPITIQAGNTRANMPARTMVVDSVGSKAYLLTSSGLSVVPLTLTTTQTPGGGPPAGSGTTGATRMQVNNNGIVNLANSSTALAANMVVSIQGSNLASDGSTPQGSALPTLLGGSCVTLDNTPIPLLSTAAGQINAQIPPGISAAKHTLVVRSVANHTSASQSLTVSKYAPAVYINSDTGQAAVYHSDGTPVSKSNPANRDEPLIMYASGLGSTTGGTVTAGNPSPSSPLAVTGTAEVHFGAVGYKQSAIIVDWSGLAPGLIGVYQLKLRVPGDHMKGDALPVTVKVGGVSSPTGSSQPVIAVQ